MKHFKYYILLFLLLGTVTGQTQVLEDIKAPTMPAATIIGTQINEISKPKTMKAFEAAILNNFLDSNNNVLIPNNYAFEINPFMLSKRTNFDYMGYLDATIKETIWRNLSFSVASTNNFVINDSTHSNAIGIGGRTIILNGKVNEKLERQYKSILEEYGGLKELESEARTLIESFIDNLESTTPFQLDSLKDFLFEGLTLRNKEKIINEVFSKLPTTTNEKSIINNFLEIFKPTFSESKLKKLKKLINEVKTERYGWRLEIDAALGLSFPTNDFNYSISPKQGVWSNISWRPYKIEKYEEVALEVPTNFEFIALARWINNNDDFINKYNPIDSTQFKTGDVIDIGLRSVLEFGKFSAEVEYIYRLNKNKEFVIVNGQEFSRSINDDTYKLILNLNYNIRDNIIFSYNIGKNYDLLNYNGGNLISGFSLNFGIGNVSKDDMIMKAIEK